MTGKDVKQQVMEALDLAVEDYGPQSEGQGCSRAIAALTSCVVLTREEAAEVAAAFDYTEPELHKRALALLTPRRGGR